MNKEVETFTRQLLKDKLSLLPEKSIHLFKRIYSPGNMDRPLKDIVDNLPLPKLTKALGLVERT